MTIISPLYPMFLYSVIVVGLCCFFFYPRSSGWTHPNVQTLCLRFLFTLLVTYPIWGWVKTLYPW